LDLSYSFHWQCNLAPIPVPVKIPQNLFPSKKRKSKKEPSPNTEIMSGFDQSLLETYEAELKALIDGIRSGLIQVEEVEKDSKASILEKISISMGEANDIIKQMNIEVRSLPSADKKVGTEKVAEFQNIMTKFKFDYDRSKEKSNRSALIGNTRRNSLCCLPVYSLT